MNTTGADGILCSPADFDVPTGGDVDLTIPFRAAAFGGQEYARVLWNTSLDTALTIVASKRLNASVVGGALITLPFSIQPGGKEYGHWTKIYASGSSYTLGQLKAGA